MYALIVCLSCKDKPLELHHPFSRGSLKQYVLYIKYKSTQIHSNKHKNKALPGLYTPTTMDIASHDASEERTCYFSQNMFPHCLAPIRFPCISPCVLGGKHGCNLREWGCTHREVLRCDNPSSDRLYPLQSIQSKISMLRVKFCTAWFSILQHWVCKCVWDHEIKPELQQHVWI